MIDESSFIPDNWPLIVASGFGGFVLLFKGGDWLADNASALAKALGASPTVIGLTVVSMATSAPELFTCVNAAIKGSDGLVVGNLVGSNFANTALILGFALMLAPLRTTNALSWWQMPFLLFASLTFTALCLFGKRDNEMYFSRWDGSICIALMLAFLFLLKRDGRIENSSQEKESEASASKCIALIIVASLMLWLGSEALVRGSIGLAVKANLNEAIIGFILLAIGTSLPELAASYSLARRGDHGILLGNIVGSNIFNLLLVGGITSAIHPFMVEESLFHIEFPAMLFVTVLMWILLGSKKALGRPQGILLLTIYIGIIATAAYFPMEARTWIWW